MHILFRDGALIFGIGRWNKGSIFLTSLNYFVQPRVWILALVNKVSIGLRQMNKFWDRYKDFFTILYNPLKVVLSTLDTS